MKAFFSTILAILFSFQMVYAGTKKTVPDKKTDWMQDQQDQTDIYAIPLDDSEAEEEEEEKEFEKLEKEHAERLKKEERN